MSIISNSDQSREAWNLIVNRPKKEFFSLALNERIELFNKAIKFLDGGGCDDLLLSKFITRIPAECSDSSSLITIIYLIHQSGKFPNISTEKTLEKYMALGNERMAVALINRGFNVTSGTFIFACQHGCSQVVLSIIQKGGIDPDCIVPFDKDDCFERSALTWAASKGDINLVKALILSKAEINMTDKNGSTPIMFAAQGGHLEILQELIKSGADVNIVCNGKLTALMYALIGGHFEVFQELINSGADVNQANDRGTTPLMLAALYGNMVFFQKLIENGAELNAEDANGNTVLSWAARAGSLSIIQALIKAKVNVDFISRSKVTALTISIYEGHLNIVLELIKAGADVNLTMCTTSPMIAAVLKGDIICVQELIQARVDLNQRTPEGRTPLMYAAYLGDVAIFELLIEHGASLDNFDEKGDSVLDCVKQWPTHGYRGMIDLIYALKPELKIRSKEIKYRKQLAHAWHLSGTSNLNKLNSNLSAKIKLEGAVTAIWYHQMQKNLDRFKTLYPNQMKDFELLQMMFKRASESQSYTDEDLLKLIINGEPVFIDVGSEQHVVTLLIWGNQFVLNDRGYMSTCPIQFLRYDQKSLTVEIINSFRKMKVMGGSTYEQYRDLFWNELPKKLSFTRTPLDDSLEIATSSLSFQTVDNCSWVSSITGVYAFLLLKGVRGEKDGQLLNDIPNNLPEAIEPQVDLYRKWIAFEQISSLEQMMKLVGKSDYEPDHALIQSAMIKAYLLDDLDDILSEKLNAFGIAYIKTLNKSDALKFIEILKIRDKDALPSERRVIL